MAEGLRRLLVDARPVDHPTARQRGIGRYVTGLLRGLTEIGAPVTALHGSDAEADLLTDVVPDLALAPWSPQVVREHAQAGTWYLATQLMLHPVPLDPVPSIVTEARLPVAAVMYDVIPERYPERYLTHPVAQTQARLRASLARTLDALLAISTFAADTAADHLRFPRDRIRVIGAGIEPQFVPPTTDPWPRLERLVRRDGRGLVVAVTGTDERKNTAGLLRAWALLPASVRERHHLVVAAAYDEAALRRWRRWASEAGVEHEVTFTGAVTDDEMVALHQAAALAVMPSIEEGFGLPVVEAAACGCPVICSDVTSLPEVLDEPDAWFDPYQPAAIAAAIEWALTDEQHRAGLRAAGARAAARWTWREVGRATVEALGELTPRHPRRLRPPARRLALAGPFEGSTSGIGAYDVSVAAALGRRSDCPELHLLVDGSGTPEPTHAHPGRFPVRAFGRYVKPWSYDHVVAVLGSSHHHVATADLARHHPTHLWLHEPSLVGVEVGLAHASGSQRWARDHVAARLGASEPPERAARVQPDDLLRAERLHELGITLLGEHLRRARSVIVSSDRAAEIVRSIDPTGAPVLVLPLAHPPVRPARSAPAGREVVCVGWLAPNKAPEVVVAAVGRLRHLPDLTLTFLGPAVGDVAERVSAAARQAGIEPLVHVTGFVEHDALLAHLDGARVGVQLRHGERGEMSGAITDLLAAGVPTVTNLATAGPGSLGLRLVEPEPAAVAAALEPLLLDDEAWRAASADARARAGAWTFDDVAAALLDWLDRAGDLAPGTVERAGPGSAAGRDR
jgi:glycosyltransferase involved in cell wall biosynthesis